MLCEQGGRWSAQGRVGGILKRAKHTGDVFQRRRLNTPLADGTFRLALEINDHEVLAREEYLSQMQVAVAANSTGIDQSTRQFT